MKTIEISLAVGVGSVLAASLVGLWPQPGLAQGDPFLGTWVLNVAQSTYSPGPPPREQTVTYEAVGEGVKVTQQGTDAVGKPTPGEFTGKIDGQYYPVTGIPDYDMSAMKRIDTHTIVQTRKRAGTVVITSTNIVSKDGNTRTNTMVGVNARGQKIHNIVVYDKK